MTPKVTIYKVADPGWRVGWNRYYQGTPVERTIGAFVTFWRWCVSLRWRSP